MKTFFKNHFAQLALAAAFLTAGMHAMATGLVRVDSFGGDTSILEARITKILWIAADKSKETDEILNCEVLSDGTVNLHRSVGEGAGAMLYVPMEEANTTFKIDQKELSKIQEAIKAAYVSSQQVETAPPANLQREFTAFYKIDKDNSAPVELLRENAEGYGSKDVSAGATRLIEFIEKTCVWKAGSTPSTK